MVLLTLFTRLYQNRLRTFKTCAELPLKNFIQTTSTGDLKYLYDVKNHEHLKTDNTEKLSMIWGDIIIEYGKLDNNLQVNSSFEGQKIIYQLEASYIVIKAMIRILMFITPQSKNSYHAQLALAAIGDLKKLGYIVNTKNSKEYAKSLHNADKRSNSIITQIRLRKNEMINDKVDSYNDISFDAIIASLNAALGFIVPDSITVSSYCEYKKVLSRKHKKNA